VALLSLPTRPGRAAPALRPLGRQRALPCHRRDRAPARHPCGGCPAPRTGGAHATAALVEGRATLVRRHGKPTIDYPAVQNRLRITPEQEAALSATGRALAQAAGVSQSRAQQFLRQHRDQFSSPPCRPRRRRVTSNASPTWRRSTPSISPRASPLPPRPWQEPPMCASRPPWSSCAPKGARARRGRDERREGKITTSSPLRKK